MNINLWFYTTLSRSVLRRSYIGKIVLVAFVGTHVPLIALILYTLLYHPYDHAESWRVLGIALVATLLGFATTLLALSNLLAPIEQSGRALRSYIDGGALPALPTAFPDTAGRLMANVQQSILRLDGVIRMLEQSATIDYGTGAFNRRYAEARLAEEVARVRHSGQQLALALIDIDHFKQINDSYGHAAGDLCLAHVVSCIRSSVRADDWLARWGGDEFVLVLYNTDRAGAEAVLRRIGAELRLHPAILPDGAHPALTLSIGVCEYNQHDGPHELLRCADGMLYAAKRNGRDQIVYAAAATM